MMALRIAHVDDDSDIRESIQRILEKNGYEVNSYLTMQDFIDSLKNNANRPDLAILDVMVESMDSGLTTFANIHKNYPEIQAIFLTSLGDMIRPYFENQSHEWVCIMEKPVEPVSLLATINERLKNRGGQAA
ncbi:response regulator transcription factor [Nitrosomonas sp. PY1]|uniref:response regulator transcription factor n=1 Tax=Nitrosomonas sp. PY1 TaxID=1803906 RepID=UPI001FC8826B|nr:response regulator [Nitrosomonas sp. PY1]